MGFSILILNEVWLVLDLIEWVAIVDLVDHFICESKMIVQRYGHVHGDSKQLYMLIECISILHTAPNHF